MLVLTRKTDEAIAVGSGVNFEHLLKVTVLWVGSGKVRLGFDVDPSVPVHRWEVWQKLHGKPAPGGSIEVYESIVLQ